jgi:hypothetical protein
MKLATGDPDIDQPGVADGPDQRNAGRATQVPESVVARVFNLDLASLLASTACKSAYEEVRGDRIFSFLVTKGTPIDRR